MRRLDVESVDRFASKDVARGLDGDDVRVLVEELEGDRVVVELYRRSRGVSFAKREVRSAKETNSVGVLEEIELDELSRGELLARDRVGTVLADEGDDGEQVVDMALCGADGRLEGFEGESAAVRWATGVSRRYMSDERRSYQSKGSFAKLCWRR